jgi:hypothetical protein
VEGPVVRVAQTHVREALVRGHEAVADDLDLRLVRHRLEVRVQDGALRVDRLAVAVARGGSRVEALRELVLGLGRGVRLVLEDEHLVGEEGVAEDGEVGVYREGTGG